MNEGAYFWLLCVGLFGAPGLLFLAAYVWERSFQLRTWQRIALSVLCLIAFSLDGALRHAAGRVAYTVVDGDLMEACRLVMSVVLGEIDPQKEDDHYGALLVEWNDAKERAKGDVIDVLRQAIARAEVGL